MIYSARRPMVSTRDVRYQNFDVDAISIIQSLDISTYHDIYNRMDFSLNLRM